MRCALEVWGADYDQLLATCRRAEALGFDAFYYGESPTGLNLDCWTTLAALASGTERIRLGPVITNVLADYRSPLLLAKQAATAAIVSGGRVEVRTGAGATSSHGRAWWAPFGIRYGPYPERAAALDAALRLLRPLWAGSPVAIEPGHEVSLGFDCPPLPITVSAVGPTGMALAATHGDTWESSFRTPDEFRALDARFDAIAAEVERPGPPPPTGIVRSLEIDAAVGTSPARAAATLDRFRSQRSGPDIDRVVERALVGQPADVADRLVALAAAGVDQVVVAAYDPHDPDALEALAHGFELADVSGDRPG